MMSGRAEPSATLTPSTEVGESVTISTAVPISVRQQTTITGLGPKALSA